MEREEEEKMVKPPPRVLYQIKEKGMERNNNKLKILPEPVMTNTSAIGKKLHMPPTSCYLPACCYELE